jgi:hypothetical protein
MKYIRERSSYIHGLSFLGYGYMSAGKWLIRFGKAPLCIFRMEIVEVFVNGGSQPTKARVTIYQTALYDVPGIFNLYRIIVLNS